MKNIPRVTQNCGIYWLRLRKYTIQLHHPRWSIENGDYYLMFPTVFRLIVLSPDETKKVEESGLGIVILGFGFSVTWDNFDIKYNKK